MRQRGVLITANQMVDKRRSPTIRSRTLYAFVLLCIPGLTAVPCAEELPFEEGTVYEMTFVRTEPNLRDDYLRNLIGLWKQNMEDAKAEGLILSYRVLASRPANEEDWDVALVVEYRNMAALDGLDAKLNRIRDKRGMTKVQWDSGHAERTKLRTLLGTKIVRELILK